MKNFEPSLFHYSAYQLKDTMPYDPCATELKKTVELG